MTKKHKRLRVVVTVFILILAASGILGVVVQTGFLSWWQPTSIKMAIVCDGGGCPGSGTGTSTVPYNGGTVTNYGSGSVRLDGGQTWYVFSKSSQLIQTLDSSRVTVSVLGLIGPQTISAQNTGWIRVEEWFTLADPIPGNTVTAPFVNAITRTLSGQLTAGTRTTPLSFIPWTVNGIGNNAFFTNWAGRTDIVFWSGDAVGTKRAAIFYLILDPSKKPSECASYSLGACVDVSDLVAAQQDFQITASIQENLQDYWFGTIFGPFPQGHTGCDFSIGQGGGSICVVKYSSVPPIPISFSAKITDFLYYTTLPNWSPTYVQTQSVSSVNQATIYISTTSNMLIISEVHSNTTRVYTNTLPTTGPGGNGNGTCSIGSPTIGSPPFTAPNPLYFQLSGGWAWLLCGKTWNSANWILVIAGIIGFIVVMAILVGIMRLLFRQKGTNWRDVG